MEFCPKGNLKDFLSASRVNEKPNREYKNIYCKLTERQLINFAAEVARGMIFLFEKKVSKSSFFHYLARNRIFVGILSLQSARFHDFRVLLIL